MNSVLLVVVVVVAVSVGVIAQQVTGLGFALLAAPILVLLLGPVEGVILVNVTSVASALIVMARTRRDIDWGAYASITVAALIGLIPGALAAILLERPALEIVIGGTLTTALVLTLMIPARDEQLRPRRLGMVAAGFVSGATNASSGIGGPPIVLFARLSGWKQSTFAATLQPYFATVGLLSAAVKAILDPASFVALEPLAWCAAAAGLALGVVIGAWAAGRLSGRTLRPLVAGVAVAGSAVVLIHGIVTAAQS